jgi:hypothetical protein
MVKATGQKQKLSDFRPQRFNANKHTARGLGMLDKSIADNGWIGAISVAADGETFDGSARLETAYTRFGDEVEPIIIETDGTRPVILKRTDIANADDPVAKKLSIAANRIAHIDLDWNPEMLAEISEEVDLSDLFFDSELELITATADDEEMQEYTSTERGATPEDVEDKFLNSSVRQFVLTYSTEEYEIVLSYLNRLMKRYEVETNADAFLKLAQDNPAEEAQPEGDE